MPNIKGMVVCNKAKKCHKDNITCDHDNPHKYRIQLGCSVERCWDGECKCLPVKVNKPRRKKVDYSYAIKILQYNMKWCWCENGNRKNIRQAINLLKRGGK